MLEKSPFRLVFDALNGNTVELKKECCEALDLDYRTLNRYYNGDTLAINVTVATRFIEWANSKRVAGTAPFTHTDLVPKM